MLRSFTVNAAQTGSSSAATSSAVLWIGVLVLMVLGGGLLVWLLRRKLLGNEPTAADDGLLTDLRRLRDSGQMTPEEFDAARKAMLRKFTADRPAKTDASAGRASGQAR